MDQHTIPVAVETVSLVDGLLIGRKQQLPAGEGACEQEQRRLREVKVRQQRPHAPEPVAGVDVEPRGPRSRPDVPPFIGDGFEDPGGGGPHGDDPFGGVDHLRRLVADLEELFVHPVILDLFDLHRSESSVAHVEGHHGHGDAAAPDLIQDRLREVQAGRGRRDGPRVPGIDGLVPIEIIGGGPACLLAADVWRQRGLPLASQEGLEGLVGLELDDPFSLVDPLQDPDACSPVKAQGRPRLDALCRSQERLPPGR